MHLVDSDVQCSSGHCSAPASRDRTRQAVALRAAGLVLPFLVLALMAVPQPTLAQGMGGGMGGMGGMGGGGGRGGGRGGRGGRSGGDSPVPRGPSGDDVAKQMQGMASLDQALRDVPNLDRQQKDSLKAIESRYGRIFESYGIAARNKVDSARAEGGAPNTDDLRTLRVAADSVRADEFVLARAVLSTDEQRARFDGNVTDIQGQEAKRHGGAPRQSGAREAGRSSP